MLELITEAKINGVKEFITENGHKLDFFDDALNGIFGNETRENAQNVMDAVADEQISTETQESINKGMEDIEAGNIKSSIEVDENLNSSTK